MKVYISGAITGAEGFEAKFREAEEHFVSEGYEVVNPVRLAPLAEAVNGGKPCCWEDYMKVDLGFLLVCGGIVHLEGWKNSRGARLEAAVARELGMKEFFY